MNLNIVDQGTVTYTLQSQTIDFVIGTSDQATFSNAHVTDNTAVIVSYITAVLFNKVTAFTLDVTPYLTICETGTGITLAVLWCKALDNNAAPFAHTVVVGIEAAEGNWLGR